MTLINTFVPIMKNYLIIYYYHDVVVTNGHFLAIRFGIKLKDNVDAVVPKVMQSVFSQKFFC